MGDASHRVSLPGGRVLIVDDEFRDWHGHVGNFVRGMAEHLAAKGGRVEVWGHAEARADLLPPTIGLRRVFHRGWRESAFCAGRWGRLARLVEQNLQLSRDVLRGAWSRPPALTVATNANLYNLLAWRFWLAVAPRRSRLVLVLFRQPWLLETGADRRWRLGRVAGIYRCLLRSFAADVQAGRCTLATETRHTGLLLARLGGVRTVIVPVPRTEAARPAARPGGEALRLGVLGGALAEKGAGEILEVIERRHRRGGGGRVRFAVPLSRGAGAPAGWNERLAALAQADPALVEIVPAELPAEEFMRMVAGLDGLLLPYWRHEYTGRGSSLAIDAICLGLPVVYARGGWTEATVRRAGAGVACRDQDAASLEEAIERLARDYDTYAAQARARAAAARREFSWETFFDRAAPDGRPTEAVI